MSLFERSAGFYDLIYSTKDYESEARFVAGVLRSSAEKIQTLLDLGCGTGTHAGHLSSMGLEVTGIDRSGEMIAEARKKLPADVSLICADLDGLRIGKEFDAVISLFHVLSYQVTDDAVEAFFATVSAHMRTGSVALIDYWNAEGVLGQGLDRREKIFQREGCRLTRTVKPVNSSERDALIEISMRVETSHGEENFCELHPMRFFRPDEIRHFVERAGLEVLSISAWPLSNIPPGPEHWSAYVLFGKSA